VERVIDGDTLFLANSEYVRLIGVDTPETKHPQKPVEYFGKEAYEFAKRMVQGKEVRLEYDQTRSISEDPPDTKVIYYPQCPIA
jgi:micrococcal nuclease